MKHCAVIFFVWLFSLCTTGATGQSIKRQSVARLPFVQVHANGHYLQRSDGRPFFWLGDTAWELFHRLTKEEIGLYLINRQQKGFTVIQAVILAEFDGLRVPNRYGQLPFIGTDPSRINEAYFELIDWTIHYADSLGLYIGLLPTWGDKVNPLWGLGPKIFDADKALAYGRFLGERYKDDQNVFWILGGDRPPVTDSVNDIPVWSAMAKGINAAYGPRALISYHISGGEISTSHFLHREEWLQINMMQSGHGSGHDVPVWDWIKRDRALLPLKPTLDAEPNYEDHPVNPWPTWDPSDGYFDDYDVRKQCYRSVFAGACGVTYGHHAVWQFWNKGIEKINHADRYWNEALNRPGAFQMGYLKQLILSRPFFERIPNDALLLEGQGKAGSYATAFNDANGRFLMIYAPVGGRLRCDTRGLKSSILRVWWFNPRTGKAILAGDKKNNGTISLQSPDAGFKKDWVLVIDSKEQSFRSPGSTL